MSFEARLAQANGRLKSSKVGVAIEVKGSRLYLRSTFPARPGSSNNQPHQQRLSLGYHANPAGLKLAEQEARKVGALLDCGEFSWEPYTRQVVRYQSVGDWVERFEADYFTRRKRTPESETTWRHDYIKVFSTLPPDEPLTIALLQSSITATKPDSRTRRRFVDVCSRLARFAGLEADFKQYKGNYSPSKVAPRNLPSDESISQVRMTIPSLTWRRAYGLIATYGLRPHEVFKCHFEAFPVLCIDEGTKTGIREVYPFYPEWAESWELQGELPACTGRNNTDLGNRVTHAFKRYQVPFAPYDLRHAWAVRTIRFRFPDTLAARQMGHSVKVHNDIYHAWITANEHRQMFELVMSQRDRPLPPNLSAPAESLKPSQLLSNANDR